MTEEKHELTPGEAAEQRQKKLVRALEKFCRTTRGTQYRMNRLVLFGENASEREWRDHPLIQLMLERRDQYRRLDAAVTTAESKIRDFKDSDTIQDGLRELARLDEQRQRHLDAIEGPLESLTKDLTASVAQISKLLAEAQSMTMELKRMEQRERHHRDGLELRKEEIEAKRKKKHISDEDIEKILGDDAV